jgi:hypothetical protein
LVGNVYRRRRICGLTCQENPVTRKAWLGSRGEGNPSCVTVRRETEPTTVQTLFTCRGTGVTQTGDDIDCVRIYGRRVRYGVDCGQDQDSAYNPQQVRIGFRTQHRCNDTGFPALLIYKFANSGVFVSLCK